MANRSGAIRSLFGQRVQEAARVLAPQADGRDALATLGTLVDAAVEATPDGAAERARLWLLVSAVAGAFPTSRELTAIRRSLELAPPDERLTVFLAQTQAVAANRGDWDRPVRIVTDATVIDVDFCAKYIHNTGIQRVVRNLVPRLLPLLPATTELVAWTREAGITRTLDAVERERVLAWATADRSARASASGAGELVIPWRSTVFLPEVAAPAIIDRLAALAEFSGNRVVMLGYDLIPIVSAQWVSHAEAERSARYLTIVKNADTVLAISNAMVGEFGGIASSFPVQGRTPPRILGVPLPSGGAGAVSDAHPADPPIVLCVGSHEPRKNQEAVLFAAETLQREGLRFRMVFVGGGDRERTVGFDRRIQQLRREHGMTIESHRRLPDSQLWELFASARFTVLLSLHEGFGLPIVESLSHGTPVLTSDYGSMAEIAHDGGCVTVNPRDDDAVIDGMRRMLTDDALLDRLRTELATIPARTWDDYTRDVAATLLGAAQ